MGAGVSGGGGSDPIININVTPLVDVCLVLVIIFMVTAPMIAQNGIAVNSVKKQVGDQADKTPAEEEQVETIYVKVLPGNAVELNSERILISDFPRYLKQLLQASVDGTVYINTTAGVSYGRVVEVLDMCRQQGAKKLAMLNDKEGLLERNLIFKKPVIQ